MEPYLYGILHTIGRTILPQAHIKLTKSHNKNHSMYPLKAMNPFTPLISLSANIEKLENFRVPVTAAAAAAGTD